MAARVGKVHRNTHLKWLTIKVGGAYIPPPRCAAARRDGAPVKLITVPWFLVWLMAGRERFRSPPVFRKAALAVFPLAFAV
jgi:hypothetical protein